ncbi:hypothetical protein [Burkholderia contaminans]|uniref:hypothetical protein n=1 Tax=Burkholderia contaminans TaxID=488447 RepID=UPI001588999A|nr:hypothetical protein [Burkholderia contaminans]
MIDRLLLQAVDFFEVRLSLHPQHYPSPAPRIRQASDRLPPRYPVPPRPGTFSRKKYLPAIVCARPRGVQFIHRMPISRGRA